MLKRKSLARNGEKRSLVRLLAATIAQRADSAKDRRQIVNPRNSAKVEITDRGRPIEDGRAAEREVQSARDARGWSGRARGAAEVCTKEW